MNGPYVSDRKQLQQAQQQQQRLMEQQRKASMFMAQQQQQQQQQNMAPAAQRRVHFSDEMPTSAPLMRPMLPAATLTNTDVVGSSPRGPYDPLGGQQQRQQPEKAGGVPDLSVESDALMSSLRLICVLVFFATIFAVPQEYRVIWCAIVTFTIIVTTSSMMSRSLIENNENTLASAVLKTGVAVFFIGTILVLGSIGYKLFRMFRDQQKQNQDQIQNQMQQDLVTNMQMANMQRQISGGTSLSSMLDFEHASKKRKKKKNRRPQNLF